MDMIVNRWSMLTKGTFLRLVTLHFLDIADTASVVVASYCYYYDIILFTIIQRQIMYPR